MLKRFIQFFSVLGITMLALTHSWASSAPTLESAQALVQQTTDTVLKELTLNKDKLKADPKSVYSVIERIILPNFDFMRMSKFVLARNWEKASPEQQQRFAKEFQNLLVRTYSTALLEAAFEGVKVSYMPVRATQDASRITLQTQVTQKGKAPIDVNYDMYITNNAWKVYNVIVSGVSLVINYRNEFDRDINAMGIDGLIAKIAARNQKAGEEKIKK